MFTFITNIKLTYICPWWSFLNFKTFQVIIAGLIILSMITIVFIGVLCVQIKWRRYSLKHPNERSCVKTTIISLLFMSGCTSIILGIVYLMLIQTHPEIIMVIKMCIWILFTLAFVLIVFIFCTLCVVVG